MHHDGFLLVSDASSSDGHQDKSGDYYPDSDVVSSLLPQ
jgi:hypothetical protein